ncbi:MAG TPA: hypothetical protein VLE49_18165 [Anaerolineales bacterium]|nr:hypothetical protein [Anaerolineales bacterium]
MFENRMNPFQNIQLPDQAGSGNIYARQYNTALSQFNATLLQGKIFRLTRKALSRRSYLYDLNVLKSDLHVRGSFYAGIRVVSIRSIIGSEGRTADFDMDFHPVNESARQRWIGLAIAYLSRLPLPPIQLIQAGDAYFVRDGHHRLSVSRAFGQMAMDAEVITWKAAPPFPWQPNAAQANAGCPDLST